MTKLKIWIATILLGVSGLSSAATPVLDVTGQFNGVADKDVYNFDISGSGMYSATLGFDSKAPVSADFLIYEKVKKGGWQLIDRSLGAGTIDFSATSGKYKAIIGSLGLRKSDVPYIFSVSAVPAVPEPATWGMLLIGLVLVGLALRRRETVRGTVFQ